MFKSLSRRGLAAAMFITLALVGGSSEAFGQNAPALQRLIAAQPPQAILQSFNPAIRAVTTPSPAPAATTLNQLVAVDNGAEPASAEENCLATAVYHEARGESIEGQLAVARVVINRAVSGKYPTSWCGVVKQPWQFSFVNPRTGHMPGVAAASEAWRKAKAITRIAMKNSAASLPTDVLWYHADYVAPGWGKRLQRVEKIGAHIFYRA
ncbi:MAG TPA: cell wall hydrolase [Sphingomicrobium sp.]|nr:cell wall hydrolase [Sphingomicrobium sp.]